jgi:hypothetical protein
MKTLLVCLALTASLAPVQARRPIVRVPDAIYLYDLGQPPLELPVLRTGVRAFSDARLTRYAGTLRFPQTVSASAFLSEASLISGLARQGRISAWVPTREIGPLPENFLAGLRKAERRRASVEALIARNEIAIGMTEEEVSRSLGRPQRTSRSADRRTSRAVWEFVRYRNVPQTVMSPQTIRTTRWHPNRGAVTTGGTFFQPATQWVRVPVGRTKVTFENGVVSAISQTEDNAATGRPRIVVPPLRTGF